MDLRREYSMRGMSLTMLGDVQTESYWLYLQTSGGSWVGSCCAGHSPEFRKASFLKSDVDGYKNGVSALSSNVRVA